MRIMSSTPGERSFVAEAAAAASARALLGPLARDAQVGCGCGWSGWAVWVVGCCATCPLPEMRRWVRVENSCLVFGVLWT